MVASTQPRRQNNTGPIDYGQGNLSPFDPRQNQDRTPPAPRNVTINVKANGTWIISWADFRAPIINGEDTNPVDGWIVGFVPQSLIGPQSSDPNWLTAAQSKAIVIAGVPSLGQGKTLTYFQSDTSLGDGYAMIWGVSISGKIGPPSQPLRVIVSTTTGAIPGDPTWPSLTRIKRQVKLADNANKVYNFVHGITWGPPADISQFGGVEMFMTGFSGSATLITLGSPCPWSRSTALHDYTLTVAADTPQLSANGHFVNGSKNIVRNSGTAFNALGTGNTLDVFGTGVFGTDYTQVYTDFYNTFTDANHIAMLSNFTGPTGDYDMCINNQWVYYLNSLSISGVRRTNPAASTAVHFF